MRLAWIVFTKELVDALRDRRTLMMVVLSSVAGGVVALARPLKNGSSDTAAPPMPAARRPRRGSRCSASTPDCVDSISTRGVPFETFIPSFPGQG